MRFDASVPSFSTDASVSVRTSYDVRFESYHSVKKATGVVTVCFAYKSLLMRMRGLSSPFTTQGEPGPVGYPCDDSSLQADALLIVRKNWRGVPPNKPQYCVPVSPSSLRFRRMNRSCVVGLVSTQ